MAKNAIILSIRPKYAKEIFIGKKSIELRRKRPKHIDIGTLVLVYVSSPTRAICGAFEVENIIEKSIKDLWKIVQKEVAITEEEFNIYFQGLNKGIGICFNNVWKFNVPLDLKKSTNLKPPQSFRYISETQVNRLIIDNALVNIVN